MNGIRLALRQALSTNRTFWRNPANAFFTFFLPLLFLVVFTALFGNDPVELGGMEVTGASFAALGLAVATVVPNTDAAPAIVNATILPVLFLSDVFINTEQAPAWVQWVGRVFPVKHLAEALQSTFLPGVVGWRWTNVLIVAAWGVLGLLVAIRRFRWEPSR